MEHNQDSGVNLKEELKSLAGNPLARQLLKSMERQRPDRTDLLIDELYRQSGEGRANDTDTRKAG